MSILFHSDSINELRFIGFHSHTVFERRPKMIVKSNQKKTFHKTEITFIKTIFSCARYKRQHFLALNIKFVIDRFVVERAKRQKRLQCTKRGNSCGKSFERSTVFNFCITFMQVKLTQNGYNYSQENYGAAIQDNQS